MYILSFSLSFLFSRVYLSRVIGAFLFRNWQLGTANRFEQVLSGVRKLFRTAAKL